MTGFDHIDFERLREEDLPEDFLERLIYVMAPPWLDEKRQKDMVSVMRIGLMGLTRDSILQQIPREKGSRFPAFIQESDFPEEFGELLELEGRLEYSPAYYAFLNNTLDITLSCIDGDHALTDRLAAWSFSSQFARISLAREIHFLQNDAASYALGRKFSGSTFKTFFEPKSIDHETGKEFVSYGQFFPRWKNRRLYKHIGINTHADAKFDDVGTVGNTDYHETTHDHQFQLGRMHRRGVKLGALEHDGLISSHLAALGSIIPPALYKPYRAQFHEVAAFAAGNQFEEELLSILGISRTETVPEPGLD